MNLKTALGLLLTALAVVIPVTLWHLELTYGFPSGVILMFVLATVSAFLTYRGARTARNWILGSLIIVCDCMLVVFSLMLFSGEPHNMISANESSAAFTLRLLATANADYAKHNQHYASNLRELEGSETLQNSGAPDLVEEVIKKGSAVGYIFNYPTPSAAGFQITASPQKPGKTGNKFFYTDQDLAIHYDQIKPATAQSPTIGD
ncbi:MAG TPA: hypothetical protein VK738_15785 [Terriglobales bacterium]|nr:hypothetical protein [Terriglobales bacterium]